MGRATHQGPPQQNIIIPVEIIPVEERSVLCRIPRPLSIREWRMSGDFRRNVVYFQHAIAAIGNLDPR